MSVFDDFRRLQAALDALELEALKHRIRDWQRGGLPASSIPGGRGGSEPPPSIDEKDNIGDRFDLWLKASWRQVETGLRNMANTAESVLRTQNAVLLQAPAIPEPEEWPCKNPACQNWHQRKEAECDRCRQWRHRNGLPFPQVAA